MRRTTAVLWTVLWSGAAILGVGCNKGATTAQQEEARVEVPVNTEFNVRLANDLDSAKKDTNDRFTARLDDDIVLNGKVAIPSGTEFHGRVTNSQTAESKGSSGFLSMTLESFDLNGATYNIKTLPMTGANPPLTQNPSDMPSRTEVGVPAAQAVKNALIPKDTVVAFALREPLTIKSAYREVKQ